LPADPRLRRLSRHLRPNLRAKVTLGVVLPLALTLGIFTALEHRRDRATLLTELSLLSSYSGQVIENNLRHEMQESDFPGVQELLDTITESERFRVVYILNPEGRVLFAPGKEGVGTFLDNQQPDCLPCHRLPAEARPASVIVEADDGQRVFRSMMPLNNGPVCRTCHGPDKRILGLLLTDIPTAPLEDSLAAATRGHLLWWSGTILVTVLIVNLGLSRLVIGRLETVAQALARFGRGQRDVRLGADSPDEIGQLVTAFNEMGQGIQLEEARNRELSADIRRHADRHRVLLKKLITAQEEERRRVARELHDDLGQELAMLSVSLQRIEQLWDDLSEPTRQQLHNTRKQIARMSDRAYEMIMALRPSALDDLGLVPALRAHAERVFGEEAGVRFELNARDLPGRLPPEVETAVFRTLQEGLGNVLRHAGASRVRLRLAVHDGAFEGELLDDGRGFDPSTVPLDGSSLRGLGLLGMQERVALCGGKLEVLSSPGNGTRLIIRIPVPEADRG
jgi:signal transduction histidine kinase